MQSARLDGMRILAFGAAVFLAVGFAWEPHWPGAMADFQAVFIASRALMHHADPYQSSNILAQIQSLVQPGNAIANSPRQMQVALLCINLPTTLCLVVPLALLPWSIAHLLWMMLTAGLFVLASWLTWDLCSEIAPLASGTAVGILVADSILLLTGGNTAGIVISLTLLAVWCFLRGRLTWLGVLGLGLALAIKPQDAGLVWLYFLLAGGVFRRRALQTLLVLAALCLPSVLWMGRVATDWPAELRANLALAASKGQLNDPGPSSVTHLSLDMPIHLQTVFSIFQDTPHFYNFAAYLLCGLLLLVWIVATLRSRQTGTTPLLALGAIAPLSLLPTYHRLYDAPLLLLAIPACAFLWTRKNRMGRWALAFLALALLSTGGYPLIMLGRLTRGLHLSATSVWNRMELVLLARPATLGLLALSFFLIGAYAISSEIDRNLHE
ncbi:MAG: glycosyltransferase 87 family protein [Terracidiphilus sp.]